MYFSSKASPPSPNASIGPVKLRPYFAELCSFGRIYFYFEAAEECQTEILNFPMYEVCCMKQTQESRLIFALSNVWSAPFLLDSFCSLLQILEPIRGIYSRQEFKRHIYLLQILYKKHYTWVYCFFACSCNGANLTSKRCVKNCMTSQAWLYITWQINGHGYHIPTANLRLSLL